MPSYDPVQIYKESVAKLKEKLGDHTEVLEWSFKWVAYVVTAASVLWAALLFLAAKNELHLVVWVEEDRLLYPSEATWKEPLPLSFQNSSATSVRLSTVKVSNYGKTLIGKQEALWSLTLEAPVSTHIAVFGKPKVSPEGVVVRILPEATPNRLTLELGALEPRASIDLHLMLVNTEEKKHPRLKIHPSLVGLPHELVARSPVDRLTERLVWHVILATLLVFFVLLGPMVYDEACQRGSGWPFAKHFATSLVVILVGAFIVGGLVLAKGLAYVVTWFL